MVAQIIMIQLVAMFRSHSSCSRVEKTKALPRVMSHVILSTFFAKTDAVSVMKNAS